MTSSRFDDQHIKLSLRGVLIAILGLFFIAYSITLRIEPSVMAHQVLYKMPWTSTDLAAIMNRYQFSMILTLLFAGFIVDKLGTRTTIITAVTIGIIGNYLFGVAQSLQMVQASRMLIGFAHPFIFVGVLKLGIEWLPKKYFGLFLGALFAILLTTQHIGQLFLDYVMQQLSWQNTINVVSVFGTILILLLLSTYKLFSHADYYTTNASWKILKNRNIWTMSVISLFGWFLCTFLLNWGITYFYYDLQISPRIGSAIIDEAFLCFALGAVVMGLISIFYQKIRQLIFFSYLIAAIAVTVVVVQHFFNIHCDISCLGELFFAAAFFSSSTVLSYLKADDYCELTHAGLTFGIVAFITTGGNTLYAAFFPQVFGLTLIPLALFLACVLTLTLSRPKPEISEELTTL